MDCEPDCNRVFYLVGPLEARIATPHVYFIHAVKSILILCVSLQPADSAPLKKIPLLPGLLFLRLEGSILCPKGNFSVS